MQRHRELIARAAPVARQGGALLQSLERREQARAMDHCPEPLGVIHRGQRFGPIVLVILDTGPSHCRLPFLVSSSSWPGAGPFPAPGLVSTLDYTRRITFRDGSVAKK